MIDDDQTCFFAQGRSKRFRIHPSTLIARDHGPAQAPSLLKVRKRSQDAVVLGRSRYDVLASKIRFPNRTVDSRMDCHRAVARPGDALRVGDSEEPPKPRAYIVDHPVGSLRTTVRSTRSGYAQLLLKIDAGL